MSDNVMSSGFMAVLNKPFNDEENEEKSEWLYDQKSNIHLNYEGTMVYSDIRSDMYGLTIYTKPKNIDFNFTEECAQLGLDIDPTTIRPYSCLWYNGSDSDMGMLTKEQYMKTLAE